MCEDEKYTRTSGKKDERLSQCKCRTRVPMVLPPISAVHILDCASALLDDFASGLRDGMDCSYSHRCTSTVPRLSSVCHEALLHNKNSYIQKQ